MTGMDEQGRQRWPVAARMPLEDLLTFYCPPGGTDWAQMLDDLVAQECDLSIVIHLAAVLEDGALREPLRLHEQEQDDDGQVYPAHLANGCHRLAAAIMTCAATVPVTWAEPNRESVLSLRVRFEEASLARASTAHPECEGELLSLVTPLRSFPLTSTTRGGWAETDTMCAPTPTVLDVDYITSAGCAEAVVTEMLDRARDVGLVPLQVRGRERAYDDFLLAGQSPEGPITDDAPVLWAAAP